MAGYSATPLYKKLGIKNDFTLYVKNAPHNYRDLIAPVPDGVSITTRLSGEIDVMHFFSKSRDDLSRGIVAMLKHMKPEGVIWVSWPKKSSKVVSDITEDVIREIILPLGLVDIKVCAVDDIWSGLKLVLRKENRAGR